MLNVVYDKNEPNDKIIDFETNVPGTSMNLQSVMDEDGTENLKLHLPEVNVALVLANQSNETPQHPPLPKPLQPLQSTSTSNSEKMDDDDEDSSDENDSRAKRKKNEIKKFLIRHGLYNLEDGPISQLVPADMMPQLFPKLTIDPRMQLIYDSKAHMPMRPRIMLYSNVEYLSKLSEALYWGVDSTCATKGMGGLHLFTVSKVTACCKEMMPLVYMVLPNKFMNTYRQAFKTIQISTPEFRLPGILVVHLKKANRSIIYAARSLYPTLLIKACFTFTSSSFWKQARRKKVPEELYTNPSTRNQLIRLLLIVFSPPSYVYQKFCEVTARPFFQVNRDVLTPFLTDFQRLYVGNGDGNAEAIFPSDVWSYYDFFTTSPMALIDESISRLLVESASPPIENFFSPIIIYNSNESNSESIRPNSQ